MTDAELTPLRAYILRFFLVDGAKTTGDLLRLPEMSGYDRRWLRKLVHSLSWAGLLDQFGSTSGAFYHTNHLGFVVLASLREDITDKRRAQPHPGVE